MNRVDAYLEPSTRLTRAVVIDEITDPTGTVVMVGSQSMYRVVRLSPLGLEILDAIGAGTTLADLEAELLDRLGDPPSGTLSEVVLEAVVGLLSAEVITAGQGHNKDIPGVTES